MIFALMFQAALGASGGAALVEGHGVLHCVVHAGAMTSCKVISESPSGKGFATAALQAAGHLRVKPLNHEGKSTEGMVVTLPFTFKPKATGGQAPVTVTH